MAKSQAPKSEAKKKADTKPVDTLQYEDDVKKGYVPEGFETVEDFLADMREEYQQDLDFDHDNRQEALQDKKFAAGEQWDPVVLEHRRGLPNLVINSIPQFTAQVVGDWRSNRNGIKIIPAEDGDVDVASVRQDLVRAIEVKSQAQRVYDNAFESMIQCGDGAFRVYLDYARDDVFDQNICIGPIDDALAVVWDRFSIDPTGRDARHVFVDDVVSKKEFERKWKDTPPSSMNDEYAELYNSGWCTEAGVKVTEYWRMIERNRLLCLFSDGKIIAFDEDTDIADLVEKHGYPVKTRIAPCSYAQMHLVTGFKILSGPHEYKISRVPIIRMMGRIVNIAGRRVRKGMVRDMKDPVRLRNFWRSVAAEQLGYAPKAQWIAPESAVEGREDAFRKAHLSRDPLLIYNDGAEAAPERVAPPALEAALLNEAAVNTQDMKDVTGIHDASLGIRSNETSGKAIMARQREGDIANLTYHDNGNAALLEAGTVVNQLIPQIYDGTRILRIIGEDEEPKFIKVNDPYDPNSVDIAVGNYDVVLTSGVSYTTRRVEAAEAMMQAIQVAPEMMSVAGDLIVKAQDWPGSDKIADRLKRAVPPQFLAPEEGGGQPGPQIDPNMIAQMQEEFAKVQEENKQLKAKTEIELLKLELEKKKQDIEWYNAETQRIRALSDHDVDANQIEMDYLKTILSDSNATADREDRREQAKAKAEASRPSEKTTSEE